MLFSYWAAAGRHVSRKPDSGPAGTISITVRACRTRWNGMKPELAQFSHLIWGWSRRVKIRIGAGRGGLGRCRVRVGLVPSREVADSRGRAARDAGALWNTNP
jgi:hypothetical protein